MKFKVLLLSSLLTLGTVSAVADEPKVDDSKPTTGDTLEQADAITEQATQPVKEKYWKCTGILSLNASATGLWNWAAGGNNNITTVAAANITLLYQKNSVAWETNLDTDFGMTYLESEFEPWRKSNDKINFTTKFGWEFHKTWYLTVLGSFKSQYARGYKYGADDNGDFKKPIAGWLSPSYTDISVGIDWKPNEIFSIYLAPVTGRISSCTLDSLSYVDGAGVEQMTSLRAAYGIDPDRYAEICSTLNENFITEYRTYCDFYDRYENKTVSEMSDAVNDAYLKSQGQQSGVASYGMIAAFAANYFK